MNSAVSFGLLLREVLHPLLSLCCCRWLLHRSQLLRECINNTCTDNKKHLDLGIVLRSCWWCSLIQIRIFKLENCFSTFSKDFFCIYLLAISFFLNYVFVMLGIGLRALRTLPGQVPCHYARSPGCYLLFFPFERQVRVVGPGILATYAALLLLLFPYLSEHMNSEVPSETFWIRRKGFCRKELLFSYISHPDSEADLKGKQRHVCSPCCYCRAPSHSC